MEFKAGSLVNVRNRDWIVIPSNNDKLVLLKPLGGSEEEITGIYLPLEMPEDKIKSTEFPYPRPSDIGDISSARILYNATRLAFRNGAGPFRSLAKLSFRPRSYQMVPLIMALKLNKVIRLLIADDVGVGKTIEALLIVKELLERRVIKRFAIVVLPHLCDQWQNELKDKFGIDAVIIRSNTQAKLDREIHGDISVYQYYPYQIISIDYIKSEQRRQVFVQECPELVIVDEAHTCSKADPGQSTRQQRHRLIQAISRKENQHLVLLTATPHSGKQEQFNSLLGLIDEKYLNLDLQNTDQAGKRDLAKHYVQRRRADVKRWMNEDTPFPNRDAGEYDYDLSEEYSLFFKKIMDFAFGLTKKKDKFEQRTKMRYWTALALLRGVMSSPAAGVKMLENKKDKIENLNTENEENINNDLNPLFEDDFKTQDHLDTNITSKTDWNPNEIRTLKELGEELENLKGIENDFKISYTLEIIKEWIKKGYNPIIFCRFIETAKYVGEVLKPELKKIFDNIDTQVITSEDPDEIRKSRIDEMSSSKRRLLIATDCLSEGINLQDSFTAVLHYDLPWNPNRLEQREGRIDRFGQKADEVKAYLLYANRNPIDGIVLKVLLRKVREIRKSIGISIPFPENSQSLMDAILQEVVSLPSDSEEGRQRQFAFVDDMVKAKTLEATKAIEKAADREIRSRNIFAQNAIKADEIEEDLRQSDEAIGDPGAVEEFIKNVFADLLGVEINKDKKGYLLSLTNLPEQLKQMLPAKKGIAKISFESPTPLGYTYIGRNHLFVEQLCQYLMANTLNGDKRYGPSRASVIKSREVEKKTTILLFRVRNVIEGKNDNNKIVAEEALVWGFAGTGDNKEVLSRKHSMELLKTAIPSSNLSPEAMNEYLSEELKDIAEMKEELDQLAINRAEILIDAHDRFRKVLSGKQYKVVEPILPMDLMGIYILLPEGRGN